MTWAAVLITLALLFYTLGVWAERIARYLEPWHVAAFWTGFLFDLSGTWAMHQLAERPFDLRQSHTLTGQIALWLMLVHAIWATRVAWKGSEAARRSFRRYSLVVWLIWLVPYFGGLYLGMTGHSDIPPTAVVPSSRQVEYHRMELLGFLHFSVNTFTDGEWDLVARGWSDYIGKHGRLDDGRRATCARGHAKGTTGRILEEEWRGRFSHGGDGLCARGRVPRRADISGEGP